MHRVPHRTVGNTLLYASVRPLEPGARSDLA